MITSATSTTSAELSSLELPLLEKMQQWRNNLRNNRWLVQLTTEAKRNKKASWHFEGFVGREQHQRRPTVAQIIAVGGKFLRNHMRFRESSPHYMIKIAAGELAGAGGEKMHAFSTFPQCLVSCCGRLTIIFFRISGGYIEPWVIRNTPFRD